MAEDTTETTAATHNDAVDDLALFVGIMGSVLDVL
jgi:hypothetical protein